ncbi:ABC transporter [Curtobacterium sp. MMLR14_010]|uniref:ABC transporter ATP-binding protein n=1 Tax=Curtobacterium sp. MMLR14_010 TaxID=1898743 RepID=UPI0008DD609C|nr:ABC transporter ATP-binding protein [Curtobacterium sp. MMLR14_010]OII35007.1 ABC transporter [Curtobacterium sp. MMLR14_010]
MTTTTAPDVGVAGSTPDRSIRCRELVRIYASDDVEVQALQGLQLDVASGELVALVGASGSGKSTLLGILSGLDRPTAGSAVVAGVDLTSMTRRTRLQYHRTVVGFVWQQTERNLVPYLTIADNVLLAMQLGGTRHRAARLSTLVDLLDLGDVLDRRPADVSGGQRQRAAVAVGLANGPSVLLADEPTGELDESTSAQLLETLRSVNRETGTTTLIVTHDATVSEHVGRTVRIRDGRTSTETLRSSTDGSAPDGEAQEFALVDRAGRLQLPSEYVDRLGLRDRVRLAMRPDHVGVYRGDDEPTDAHDGPPTTADDRTDHDDA